MRLARKIVLWLVSLAVGTVVLLTLASFAFNAVTNDPNVPVTKLWHGKFVIADGVLTAYRQWGTHGSPIILVGGLLEPSFVWDGVGPRLAASGHRVYALDLDGFGYTQRRGPSSLTEWADQVQGFAGVLDLKNPVIAGHSLGAAVAVEVARRRVASRIVLLDGDALSVGGPPHWLRETLVRSPFFTTALRLAPHASWAVRRVLANAYGPNAPKLDHADLARWTDQLRAADARVGLQRVALNGLTGFSLAELKRTRIKARVVWGAEDSVDDPAAGRATAAALHARFVELPGAGHLSMLTAPAAVAAAIR